jgi:hypothetical protein
MAEMECVYKVGGKYFEGYHISLRVSGNMFLLQNKSSYLIARLHTVNCDLDITVEQKNIVVYKASHFFSKFWKITEILHVQVQFMLMLVSSLQN